MVIRWHRKLYTAEILVGATLPCRFDAQQRSVLVVVGEEIQKAVRALAHVANALPQIDEQRLASQLFHVLVDQEAS